MAEPIPRTPLDISRLDCLLCGGAVFSEKLDAKGQHLWRVYRYKDRYVYFTETMVKGDGGKPSLGFEVDKVNLEKLFNGEHFLSLMIPVHDQS